MEAQMVQAVGTIASPVAMVAVMIYMMRQFGSRLDGIGNRIDKLDARLSERIDKLDARLRERIDKLDARLSDGIGKLDARLSDGIDKLDARLSQRIDRVDSRIEGLQEDHKNLATQLSELRGSLET